MTTPIYFCLDLRDDAAAIDTYRKLHAPGAVPLAVTNALRKAAIEELEIYLVGNRLFMVLRPGPDFDAARKAEADALNPDVQAWEKRMWELQKALPFAAPGQKWVPLERIYSLSEQ